MISSAELAEHMGITSTDAGLSTTLDKAVAATNALIVERCVALEEPWPDDVHYAALLQGARLVKRRASPEGVAGMGDFGPVRVSVMDPDIEALLSPWLWLAFS